MDKPIRDTIWMFLAVIVTVSLIVMAMPMIRMAHDSVNEKAERETKAAQLAEAREWSRYMGAQSGADLIGFVSRHQYVCDIVIQNADWDLRLTPMLTDGALVLGPSERRNLPDYVWDTVFIYDVILSGNGHRLYHAELLYDGQLSPGEGTTVTGVIFEEVL